MSLHSHTPFSRYLYTLSLIFILFRVFLSWFVSRGRFSFMFSYRINPLSFSCFIFFVCATFSLYYILLYFLSFVSYFSSAILFSFYFVTFLNYFCFFSFFRICIFVFRKRMYRVYKGSYRKSKCIEVYKSSFFPIFLEYVFWFFEMYVPTPAFGIFQFPLESR